MAIYRYARDSRTSAQNEARKWKASLDAALNEIGNWRKIAATRELSKAETRRKSNAEKKIAKLMENNPNEPI